MKQSQKSHTLSQPFNLSQQLFLPKISSPKYVVFSDLDGTYLNHQTTSEEKQWLFNLENFLKNNCHSLRLLFGLVTGSPLSLVYAKMAKYQLQIMPHFIASAFGTELTYFDEHCQDGRADDKWLSYLQTSNYSKEKVEQIINELSETGLKFKPQVPQNNSQYKNSYHYFVDEQHDISQVIATVRHYADSYGITVNMSRCNPQNDDPHNAYDVDFLPKNIGKKQVVQHILSTMNISHENSLAFGDSGNDLEMLQMFKHGYLVANATEEAKSKHDRVLRHPHARGILSAIQEVICGA